MWLAEMVFDAKKLLARIAVYKKHNAGAMPPECTPMGIEYHDMLDKEI